jgi:hypothetical protein
MSYGKNCFITLKAGEYAQMRSYVTRHYDEGARIIEYMAQRFPGEFAVARPDVTPTVNVYGDEFTLPNKYDPTFRYFNCPLEMLRRDAHVYSGLRMNPFQHNPILTKEFIFEGLAECDDGCFTYDCRQFAENSVFSEQDIDEIEAEYKKYESCEKETSIRRGWRDYISENKVSSRAMREHFEEIEEEQKIYRRCVQEFRLGFWSNSNLTLNYVLRQAVTKDELAVIKKKLSKNLFLWDYDHYERHQERNRGERRRRMHEILPDVLWRGIAEIIALKYIDAL